MNKLRYVFLAYWMLVYCLFGGTTNNLTYSQSPVNNPIKGIAGNMSTISDGEKNNIPHSLFFSNFSLRDCVTASNTYNWTDLEDNIALATNDGSQIVVRFVIDMPGSSTWIPQYLLDAGLWTTSYDDGGVSLWPDYTNGLLRGCLTNFIAQFGSIYDGDPRIAFVQMGLIGNYGEWDYDFGIANFWRDHGAPMQTEQEVYYAYTNAFRKTKLLVRYPAGTNNSNGDISMFRNDNLPFGYYDDGFCSYTVPVNYDADKYLYYMWKEVAYGTTNNWKLYPYGGETFYTKGQCIFSNTPCVSGVQTWSNCVTTTHASYMHCPAPFYITGHDSSYSNNVVTGALLLGYELYAKTFASWRNGNDRMCSVTMTNTGVAPFYYDWQIQLAAVTNGVTAKTWQPTWQLTSVIPGDGDVTYTMTLTNPPSQTFTLVMRAVNPMANGKPLIFANAEEHDTITNWLTLGDISPESIVNAGTLNVKNLRIATPP